MICINISYTGEVSAATIKINSSSDYNTTNSSVNEQIQSEINSAKSGDTVEFLGKFYGNSSLVISKSLNIISLVHTVISSNSINSPVFLITGCGSRWTNITGFNIESSNGNGIVVQDTTNIIISKNNIISGNGTGIVVTGSNGVNIENNTISNSQTGLSVTNSKNINVTNNSIKNSYNDGIDVDNSQNLDINKNSAYSNGNYGIYTDNSQNLSMQNNSIENNENNGVNLEDTNEILINNNNINANQGNGIYFDKNVNDTQITSNNINSNDGTGIELDKSGADTLIDSNIINNDLIGIDIDSSSDNLIIKNNTITGSIYNGGEDSGVGINIGIDYTYSKTLDVTDNNLVDNQQKEVILDDPTQTVKFGANWYGSNYRWGCNICPFLQTELLMCEFGQSIEGGNIS